MIPTEIIKTKRSQQPLTLEEIQFFIQGYTEGSIPDYQMSALLMAIFLNGMTAQETIDLTQVMLDSGTRLNFDLSPFAVDKHSTGGVGDKTSLILAPIVAACGVPVPMMSGRGLGHTGGTLDKLEAIPGFDVNLSLDRFQEMVSTLGLSFIGQTKDICPADKKIYSLRDVTGTVESLPLICASIMSKKIAEGIKGLVLDVKWGSGAFMKTPEAAKELAMGLINIGRGQGIETRAILSNMNQPLGRFVGNALEVQECLCILQRKNFGELSYKEFFDTEELSLTLAAHMISIAKNQPFAVSYEEGLEALNNGTAFEKFAAACKYQGGELEKLPTATKSKQILAQKEGFLSALNSEKIGVAGITLGAGRKKVTDSIDPVAGFQVHKKLGDSVKRGDTLFTIFYSGEASTTQSASELLENCFSISEEAPKLAPLILETIS